MSEINYQALRERYSPVPVPKCPICGEEMSIQRISGAQVVYACSGYGDDGDFKIGRTLADEHYEKSHVTVLDVGILKYWRYLIAWKPKTTESLNWKKSPLTMHLNSRKHRTH